MKFAILLASLCAVISSGSKSSVSTRLPLQGDYVEARTASVYAGPCHYNGELMTSGRSAIMAWNFTSGSWKGVDLTGVKVVAMVSSDSNLSDNVNHSSEIVVDKSATSAQADAAVAALNANCVKQLGRVISVHRAAIAFSDKESQYDVTADGFAQISTEPMPDAACCLQPNLVWYSPLVSLTNSKVGYTDDAAYTAGTLGDTWERSGENSAFYGAFKFN